MANVRVEPVHVAVGIIINADQQVMITRRADHLHQGGLWEFPGGKLEPGESILDALKRELSEELNLQVVEAEPVMQIDHDYGDKCVLLDVWRVLEYCGEPVAMESQPMQWAPLSTLRDYRFPVANEPIVDYLAGQPAGEKSAG